MKREVGFSIGSNMGDKQHTIEAALVRLFSADIDFLAASSFYRTKPWGYEAQDWFLNVCAAGLTALGPRALLELAKRIERDLGRTTTFRWGPRVIDVDILYLGEDEITEPDLAIPHKELFNRAFVLIPLAEIRPDLELAGRRIGEAAAAFAQEPIEIVAKPWKPAG